MDKEYAKLLERIMPAGYKMCLKYMGTGRVADLDDLNDLDTIRVKPCKACGGVGFVHIYRQED